MKNDDGHRSDSLLREDGPSDEFAELDRLWGLELPDEKWLDMLQAAEDWADYAGHIGSRCPITIMMSGTDPGLDCLIEHDLCEGMSSTVYGVDMEVSIGGNNDREGVLAGKRRYEDLDPSHATDFKATVFGVPDVHPIPPVKTVWPERYPQREFDRVRYAMEIDKETIRRLVEHNLYFYKISNDDVPAKQTAIMAKLMGPYFLDSRVDEGQDHYFSPLEQMAERPANRKDAYLALREHWQKHRGAGYCPVSASTPLLNNIMATEGKGIIQRYDPEVAWLSTQVLCAMQNGLARSLGVPWTIYFATESTSRDGPGKRPVTPDTPYEGLFRFSYWHGDRPFSLIERQLYTYWMEGVDFILVSDGAHLIFRKGPDEDTFLPSEFGLKIKRLNDLAMSKNGFDRGEVYRPAALMLERYTNWMPACPNDGRAWDPPLAYHRTIMGIEPYRRKDFMIDNFMGAIFPEHEWGGSWGTFKGDLVNAPYGDSFEVVYDSVDPAILATYPCCFVLGEPEITDELKGNLRDYVNNGGDLVLNIAQVDGELLDFAGVRAEWHTNRWYRQLGEMRVADASKDLLTGVVYEEDRYHYTRVETEAGTEVQAETASNPNFAGDLDAGWPLVTKVPRGEGSVYLVLARHMQNSSCLNFPYGLLKICKDFVGHILEPRQLVTIDGPPLQYIVSRKEDGGVVVTAINNDQAAWEGSILVKGASQLTIVREWYQDLVPEIRRQGGDAVLETSLGPGDIRIYTFEK